MNISLLHRTFVTIALLSAYATANAHEPHPGRPSESAWQVVKHTTSNLIEATASGAGGTFGAACRAGQCAFFIEPASGCNPGQNYPLLINTARSVGIVPSECTIMETVDGADRLVARVLVQQAFFEPIRDGLDVSIGFPAQSGSLDVIAVSTIGLRAAVKEMKSFLPAVGIEVKEPEDERFSSL